MKISKIIADLLNLDLTTRGGAWATMTIIAVAAMIFGIMASSIPHGSKVLLGKVYGKPNIIGAIFRILFYAVSAFFWLYLISYILSDYFHNFFRMGVGFSGIINILINIILQFALNAAIYGSWIFGRVIANRFEAKRDIKFQAEIDNILKDNPVFCDALNILESDDQIKMVRIFRDGIAFYSSVQIPENINEKIEYGAMSNSEAKKLLEEKKNALISSQGSVKTAIASRKLVFLDYGYNDSESAMTDLAYSLTKRVTRFSNAAHQVSLEYRSTLTSGPTHYVITNNTATPAGGSSKTISANSSFHICEILYVKENSLTPPTPPQPTKHW